MPSVRTVLHIPGARDSDMERHGAIAGTLAAISADFRVTPRNGYRVAGATFDPGDWMLINRSGVWKVDPVAATTLQPGDGILGFVGDNDADIYDAVFVLKYAPQVCDTSIRLVPDHARCHPARYRFGVVYASPGDRMAWKHIPAPR